MLQQSNGEAVHFGRDVVALEKNKMFKRVYVHGEYSVYFYFFFPPSAFPTNTFEGCRFRVRRIISVGVSV